MDGVRFTKTEQAIMAVLCDGHPHLPDDLLVLLDEQADRQTLHNHLSRIRKKLPIKHAIICQYKQRMFWFRLMRSI